MSKSKRFYTRQEVADLLRVSERTVRRWIAEKGIQPAKFPNRNGGRGVSEFLTEKQIEALKA